jgi:hypothetical protein
VRDFTRHKDVKFRVDDDVFVGVTGIPALNLMKFGVLFDGLSERDIMNNPQAFTQMIDLILTDASAARFNARMEDKNNPIAIEQVMDILPWVMEQYGMRPTRPSPESSAGSVNPVDGTSLTDRPPETVLTPSLSPQPAS